MSEPKLRRLHSDPTPTWFPVGEGDVEKIVQEPRRPERVAKEARRPLLSIGAAGYALYIAW